MNILHSFSHTDLALELKDELEESCEREQFLKELPSATRRLEKRGLRKR